MDSSISKAGCCIRYYSKAELRSAAFLSRVFLPGIAALDAVFIARIQDGTNLCHTSEDESILQVAQERRSETKCLRRWHTVHGMMLY